MSTAPGALRSVVKAYALSLAIWMPLSVLVAWQGYRMAREAHLPAHLQTQLLVYAARYFAVGVLTPPIFYWVARYPVSGRDLRRLGPYLAGFPVFAIAFALIRFLLLPPWVDDARWGPRSFEMLLDLSYSTFADLLLLYLVVVLAAHAYTYFVKAQQQELDRLRLRQSLAHSELQALRAQLQPHFLFNTLQGLSTLIDTDPHSAQKMLRTLATLLRTVLKHGTADLISLREELEFARAYLELTQMRLGDRLAVQWHIEPAAEGALIPQMLLQPLLENAVVHGISPAAHGGSMVIEATVQAGRLQVEIRNSVAGPGTAGLQLGLSNVRAQLRHLYSEDAHFEFCIDEMSGTAVARVSVPALAGAAADSRAPAGAA